MAHLIDPKDPIYKETEAILVDLQFRRSLYRSRTVPDQGKLCELLRLKLIKREDLTDEEHIAIYGLNYEDSKAEMEAWEIMLPYFEYWEDKFDRQDDLARQISEMVPTEQKGLFEE